MLEATPKSFKLRAGLLGVTAALGWTGSADAYNSEEHKLVVDGAATEVVADPRIEFEYPTRFVEVERCSLGSR